MLTHQLEYEYIVLIKFNAKFNKRNVRISNCSFVRNIELVTSHSWFFTLSKLYSFLDNQKLFKLNARNFCWVSSQRWALFVFHSLCNVLFGCHVQRIVKVYAMNIPTIFSSSKKDISLKTFITAISQNINFDRMSHKSVKNSCSVFMWESVRIQNSQLLVSKMNQIKVTAFMYTLHITHP